jgi:hypothetical protein
LDELVQRWLLLFKELLFQFGVLDSSDDLKQEDVLHIDFVQLAFPRFGLFSYPPLSNRLSLSLATLLEPVSSKEEGVLLEKYGLEFG